ncbi:hypothetical protein DFH06DRAFT_1313283 [Mycena polygramma]|nr:hypothetical protein DFH06DRAFT_1313283 [Mycena polygramma]
MSRRRFKRRHLDTGASYDPSQPRGIPAEEEDEDLFVVPDKYLAMTALDGFQDELVQGEPESRLFVQSPEEEAEDFARDAQRIAQRFSTFAEQGELPVGIGVLWKVQVKKGHERGVVNTICRWSKSKDAPPYIRNTEVFETAGRGHVYISAPGREEILEIQKCVVFIKNADPLRVDHDCWQSLWKEESQDLTSTWVRYTGSGKYCGNLAWVVKMNKPGAGSLRSTLDIAMVPRLSVAPPQRLSSLHVPQLHTEVEKKRKLHATFTRPPRSLFLPEQEPDVGLAQVQCEEAKGDEYWGGLRMLRSVPLTRITEDNVGVSWDEVKSFQASPVYSKLFMVIVDQRYRCTQITVLLKALRFRIQSPGHREPCFLYGFPIFEQAVTLFRVERKHADNALRRRTEREELLAEHEEKMLVRRKLQDLRDTRAAHSQVIQEMTGFDSRPVLFAVFRRENEQMEAQGKKWMYMLPEQWDQACRMELEALGQDIPMQEEIERLEGQSSDLLLWQALMEQEQLFDRKTLILEGWTEEILPPNRSSDSTPLTFHELWNKLRKEGVAYMAGRDELLQALKLHGGTDLYDRLMTLQGVREHAQQDGVDEEISNLLNLFKLPPQGELVEVGDKSGRLTLQLDETTHMAQLSTGIDTVETGFVVDLDWEQREAEMFRRVPPLANLWAKVAEVPPQETWAPELIMVDIATLKLCEDVQLQRREQEGKQDPGLQTEELKNTLVSSQNLECTRKHYAKYIGLQVEVVRGKEDQAGRYVRTSHPDKIWHLRSCGHINLPMQNTEDVRTSGVEETALRPRSHACVAQELQLKGTRSTVKGTHYVPETGWWLDIQPEGRAVNSVIQVRERYVVERFTRQQLHIFIYLAQPTRDILEERVRKDKEAQWAVADQELEFDRKWPHLVGLVSLEDKLQRLRQSAPDRGDKTPQYAPPIEEEEDAAWFIGTSDHYPVTMSPEVHAPLLASPLSSFPRPMRPPGTWCSGD